VDGLQSKYSELRTKFTLSYDISRATGQTIITQQWLAQLPIWKAWKCVIRLKQNGSAFFPISLSAVRVGVHLLCVQVMLQARQLYCIVARLSHPVSRELPKVCSNKPFPKRTIIRGRFKISKLVYGTLRLTVAITRVRHQNLS
jgi:hypothetical protein